MAGQFAKPRSSGMEKVGDAELPSYRCAACFSSLSGRLSAHERLESSACQSALETDGGSVRCHLLIKCNTWMMTSNSFMKKTRLCCCVVCYLCQLNIASTLRKSQEVGVSVICHLMLLWPDLMKHASCAGATSSMALTSQQLPGCPTPSECSEPTISQHQPSIF